MKIWRRQVYKGAVPTSKIDSYNNFEKRLSGFLFFVHIFLFR